MDDMTLEEFNAARIHAVHALSEMLATPVMYDPFAPKAHAVDLMHRRSTFGDRVRSVFRSRGSTASTFSRSSTASSAASAVISLANTIALSASTGSYIPPSASPFSSSTSFSHSSGSSSGSGAGSVAGSAMSSHSPQVPRPGSTTTDMPAGAIFGRPLDDVSTGEAGKVTSWGESLVERDEKVECQSHAAGPDDFFLLISTSAFR